jgi:hypothetical protein
VKTRAVLEGVGAALLLLLTYIWPCIEPLHLALYSHRLPASNLVGGLLVDMLGLSILAIGFLIAIQYLPRTLERTLSALFASLMLLRILDIAIQMQTNPHIIAHWGRVRMQSCIAILLLFGLLAFFLPRSIQPVVRAVNLTIAAFAFCAFWIIPQLLYLTLAGEPGESAASIHIPLPRSRSNQRIIWILFDELSYDQAFDHPASSIKLPNFDRLRTESISFNNLQPAGYHTDKIIPSLFLGRRIDQTRATLRGDLWYMDESQNHWLAYDPNATLFGLAKLNGWTSGVDGWFYPYCRSFAPVLDVCFWEPFDFPPLPMEAYGASEKKSVLTNAAALPNAYLSKLTHRAARSPSVFQNDHIQQFQNVMAHTQELIENDQVRFVFLHLPIPHPPGIYDRERHMLRPSGNYLDNLVLADDTLGALMKEIDATPLASRTTVIISSDHSWRIPMWKPAEYWSTEEERASGGRFDNRPVLLIHFPGQKDGNEIKAALPEMIEHDIVAEVLRGRMGSPEDLSAFLTRPGR